MAAIGSRAARFWAECLWGVFFGMAAGVALWEWLCGSGFQPRYCLSSDEYVEGYIAAMRAGFLGCRPAL